jgi:hypothetical protein
MKDHLNTVAIAGLAMGVIFGTIGTFLESVRNVAWEIDGAGLVMAAAILALKFYRKGNDFLAAGFLVFSIAEAVIMSGLAAGIPGSMPAFAAGSALWATALLLISIPRGFPVWVRGAGVASAILFAAVSTWIFSGHVLTPVSTPLPFFAYPFLVATFVGWIWNLLREA